MGSFKKTPRLTDQELAKTWLGWALLVRRLVEDVRALHVCVQDEISLIGQHIERQVSANPIDRESETKLARHLDESVRLLEQAMAKLKRLRSFVRS